MPGKIGSAALWIAPPADWLRQGIALRLRQADDRAFLRALFETTPAAQLLAASFDAGAAAPLIDSQFDFQCRHFDAHYREGGQRIIAAAHDKPIGRIELWRSDADSRRDLRIVDITLLPEWCGRGVGSALLSAVQRAAADDARSVSLHVDKMNPAYRLYARLGFRAVADAGASWRMEWRAF